MEERDKFNTRLAIKSKYKTYTTEYFKKNGVSNNYFHIAKKFLKSWKNDNKYFEDIEFKCSKFTDIAKELDEVNILIRITTPTLKEYTKNFEKIELKNNIYSFDYFLYKDQIHKILFPFEEEKAQEFYDFIAYMHRFLPTLFSKNKVKTYGLELKFCKGLLNL